MSIGNLSGSSRWLLDQLCSGKHCSVLIMSRPELGEKYTDSNLLGHQAVKHLKLNTKDCFVARKL